MEEDLDEGDRLAEIAELMESNGGTNHGRVRTESNEDTRESWRPLDGAWDEDRKDWVPVLLEDAGIVSVKGYPVASHSTTDRHGTRYSYAKLGCRCDSCRKANADYFRSRRNTPDGGTFDRATG